jgi:hypothetical protein
MAGEILESMSTILENLVSSNDEMNAKMDEALVQEASEQTVEENIIPKPEINASLSGDESARYRNIGQELFSPILKSLDKMLKKADKKNDMKIDDGKEEGGEVVKEKEEDPLAKLGIDLNTFDFCSIFNFSNGIKDELIIIVALLGAAALGFFSNIGDFFSGVWDWIKDFFAPVGDFFDFSNGPLAGVFAMIGGAISGLWKLVSGVFKALGKAGEWIWEGIKKIFTTFITGPNGILSFGVKLVKGIVDFAGKAFSWLGDLISNVILGPIKAIFGGAEETGKATGEAVAQKAEAAADDSILKQKMETEALANDAIHDSQQLSKQYAECAAKTRAEATEQAKKAGIRTNEDGTISAEAIKDKMAADVIKMYEDQAGEALGDKERAQMAAIIKSGIHIDGNNISIESDKIQNELKAQSENLKLNVQAMNAVGSDMMEGLGGQAQQMIDLYMRANMADDYNAKTEKEQFIYRMQKAREQGQLAEFRITEAREMIILMMDTVKNTFNGFKTQLSDTFKNAFEHFTRRLKDILVINFLPEYISDYSRNQYDINRITNNGTIYQITPVKKEDFNAAVGQMTALAETNVEMVSKQNIVLAEIKDILEKNPTINPSSESTTTSNDNSTTNSSAEEYPTKDERQNSSMGMQLRSSLFTASSFAF